MKYFAHFVQHLSVLPPRDVFVYIFPEFSIQILFQFQIFSESLGTYFLDVTVCNDIISIPLVHFSFFFLRHSNLHLNVLISYGKFKKSSIFLQFCSYHMQFTTHKQLYISGDYWISFRFYLRNIFPFSSFFYPILGK